MSTESDEHWSATAYQITVGRFPARFFLPVPILPFYHPIWLVALSLVWMVLVYWLFKKGMGLSGMLILARRWLQGSVLSPRPKKTQWQNKK